MKSNSQNNHLLLKSFTDKIIINILSYLKLKDIKTASLINKNFYFHSSTIMWENLDDKKPISAIKKHTGSQIIEIYEKEKEFLKLVNDFKVNIRWIFIQDLFKLNESDLKLLIKFKAIETKIEFPLKCWPPNDLCFHLSIKYLDINLHNIKLEDFSCLRNLKYLSHLNIVADNEYFYNDESPTVIKSIIKNIPQVKHLLLEFNWYAEVLLNLDISDRELGNLVTFQVECNYMKNINIHLRGEFKKLKLIKIPLLKEMNFFDIINTTNKLNTISTSNYISNEIVDILKKHPNFNDIKIWLDDTLYEP